MKKFLIICLLIFNLVLPCFAKNWMQVGNKSYMDTDSIEQYIDDHGNKQENQYCFWVKHLNNGDEYFKKIEKTYNKKVHYMLSKIIVDTYKNRLATKCSIVYDINGSSLFSNEQLDFMLEWQSIVPDTVGEAEMEIVKAIVELVKSFVNKNN